MSRFVQNALLASGGSVLAIGFLFGLWHLVQLWAPAVLPAASVVEISTTPSKERGPAPTGALLLSGVERTEPEAVWQTYSLTFGSESPTWENQSAQYNAFSTAEVQAVDPTDPEHFFFKAVTAATSTNTIAVQLFERTTESLIPWPVTLPPVHAHYDWSAETDLLAYSYQTDAEDAAAWRITVVNRTGEPQATLPGYHPVWLSSGEAFLYLKEDGLYAYQLDTASSTLLLRVQTYGGSGVRPTFTLSEDDLYLILAYGTTYIYVLGTEEDQLVAYRQSVVYEEDYAYYNAILSPNSRHYATVAVPRTDAALLPQLEIRVTDTNEVVERLPLSQFDPTQLQLNDWVTEIPKLLTAE